MNGIYVGWPLTGAPRLSLLSMRSNLPRYSFVQSNPSLLRHKTPSFLSSFECRYLVARERIVKTHGLEMMQKIKVANGKYIYVS